MLRLAALLTAALVLAACEASVRGPSVEIEPPKIRIGDSGGHGGGGGGFCPPGQAKKGNC